METETDELWKILSVRSSPRGLRTAGWIAIGQLIKKLDVTAVDFRRMMKERLGWAPALASIHNRIRQRAGRLEPLLKRKEEGDVLLERKKVKALMGESTC